MIAWAGSWLWLGYAGGSFDCGDEGCGTAFSIAAALVKWLSIALTVLLVQAALSWLHRRSPGRPNARESDRASGYPNDSGSGT